MSEKKSLEQLRKTLGVTKAGGAKKDSTLRGRPIPEELINADRAAGDADAAPPQHKGNVESTLVDPTGPPIPPPTPGASGPGGPPSEGTLVLAEDDLEMLELEADAGAPPPSPTPPQAPPPQPAPVDAAPPAHAEPVVDAPEEPAAQVVDRPPEALEQAQQQEQEQEQQQPALTPGPARPGPTNIQPDELDFYHREATAAAKKQPERSGLLWLEAARAAENHGADTDAIVKYLDAALKQAEESPYVVPLARKMMLRLGRHERALELTDKQTTIGGDNRNRVGALLEAVALQRHVRHRPPRALKLIKQVLDLCPGHPLGLYASACLNLEQGNHGGAAAALEQLAESLFGAHERASCLHLAGSLRELRLDEPDRAEQDYQRAVELDPQSIPARVALCDLYQQTGAWHHLCSALEQLANMELGATVSAGYLLRAGDLHLNHTGDLEAAARTFAAAAEVTPTAMAPLTRLAYVQEATGHKAEQIETLGRLLQLTLDPLGQAALLARVGRLQRERPGHQEEAIAAYRQCLALQPGYFPALQALGTLFRHQSDFDSLLEILLPETEGSESVERRAMRCLEVASILVDRLDRAADAIEVYQRALELDPNLRLAAWRLGAQLSQQGRPSELARLLAWQAEVSSDQRSKHHLLVELSRLQAGPLAVPHRAIETLEQARACKRNRIAEMALIDLHAHAGNFTELAELLLSEAQTTRDDAEAKWRRIQAAMVLEDQLGEHDRAIEIFWEVLKEHPACVGALRAAGQIYYAHGRWQELIKLHQHELEADPNLAESPEPWCRIGRIYDEELGQPAEAIKAYTKALELETDSTVALDALERLVRGEERYQQLVSVLERFARKRRDPYACADLLCHAAELADSKLEAPERAEALFAEALERSPGSPLALESLFNLQLRQQSFDQAAATLDLLLERSDDPAQLGVLLLQRARIQEYRLGERVSAAPYDGAAEADAGLRSRLRLEQIRARLAHDDGQLQAVLLAAGEEATDDLLAQAHLLDCAHRHEAAGEAAEQLQVARRALERDGGQLAAIWCHQRALRAGGQWSELAASLELEAGTEEDPAMKIHLLSEATAAQLGAEQLTDAARLASQCLAVDRGHVPSLRRLAWLAEQWQNWSELGALLDQQAEACVDPSNRLQACLLAADNWSERAGDAARSLASLTRALADDPDQTDAFARAERLLVAMGDYEQLSGLYAARIGAVSDVERKAALLRQHARLIHDKLGDVPRAINELTRLLKVRPGDLGALKEQAELLRADERWSDAAGALAQLATRTEDREERQQARLTQASILLKRLHQLDAATQVLQAALEEEPGNLGAKRGMVEVHLEQGSWDEAQQLLDEVSAEDQPELQVWALSQLTELARVGLRDAELRERYERETLTLAATHPDLLEQLVEQYRGRRMEARLIEAGTAIVEQTTDADVAARLRLLLARLLIDDVKQPVRALDYLRDALAADPQNTESSLLMARAMEQQGEMEDAVGIYRSVLHREPSCAEAYRGLFRLMGVLGKPTTVSAAAAVLDLLGQATTEEQLASRSLDRATVPPGSIVVGALPIDAGSSDLRELLELTAPYLGGVFPLALTQIQKWSHPAAAAAKRLADLLGLGGVKVSIEGDRAARAGIGDPAALQINQGVANEPQSAAFRFWVARALARSAAAGALLEQLSDGELGELVEALTVSRPIDAQTQKLRKQAIKALPRKVRKLVDQLKPKPPTGEVWARLREQERLRADRIGLLVCGSPKVAVTELATVAGHGHDPTSSPYLCELITFSVSDDYARLHAQLWSAARPATR